jgi:hypothetical protein
MPDVCFNPSGIPCHYPLTPLHSFQLFTWCFLRDMYYHIFQLVSYLWWRAHISFIMNNLVRRFLNQDILSTIPPGTNPFTYLINLAAPAMSYLLSSTTTQYIQWVLFVLHWLIVVFCLVILGLLYQRGDKQFLWFFRRLNIKDKIGKNGWSFINLNNKN